MVNLVTADNLGVIPPAVAANLLQPLSSGRPFLSSTTRLDKPLAGMGLTLPLVVVRPTAGAQEHEKDLLTHTATDIRPTTFGPTTVGGYGDASFQLLRRSDPSYFDMYLALLAEAYGESADAEAIAALLDAAIVDGGTFDPADFEIGTAVVDAYHFPDTLWHSTAAATAIIDAKGSGGEPIYPNGVVGEISVLRPVYVPALDGTEADVIVGSSRGFMWSEDGAYNAAGRAAGRGGAGHRPGRDRVAGSDARWRVHTLRVGNLVARHDLCNGRCPDGVGGSAAEHPASRAVTTRGGVLRGTRTAAGCPATRHYGAGSPRLRRRPSGSDEVDAEIRSCGSAVSDLKPSSGEAVWARRHLSSSVADQDVEQALWHRALSVNDTAVQTACHRFFIKPLDLSTAIPDGDSLCRLCDRRAAADRPSANPKPGRAR